MEAHSSMSASSVQSRVSSIVNEVEDMLQDDSLEGGRKRNGRKRVNTKRKRRCKKNNTKFPLGICNNTKRKKSTIRTNKRKCYTHRR